MENETTFVVGSDNAGRWVKALNEKRRKIIMLLGDLKHGLQGEYQDQEKIAITLDNI